MTARKIDRHLDALADVTPAAFVKKRNQLADALKAKDPAAAHELRALRRPAPAPWALAQIARHEPAAMRAYLDAAEQLAASQTGRGRGDPGEAICAEREARQALMRRATAVLTTAGIKLTPQLRRHVLDTAFAAATGDRAARKALAAGALRDDLSPVRDLEELGIARASRPAPKAAPTARALKDERAAQAQAAKEAARAAARAAAASAKRGASKR